MCIYILLLYGKKFKFCKDEKIWKNLNIVKVLFEMNFIMLVIKWKWRFVIIVFVLLKGLNILYLICVRYLWFKNCNILIVFVFKWNIYICFIDEKVWNVYW